MNFSSENLVDTWAVDSEKKGQNVSQAHLQIQTTIPSQIQFVVNLRRNIAVSLNSSFH
ncbi:hypothetical protein Hanom_Chr11g01026721 [Helianthus anomalus]